MAMTVLSGHWLKLTEKAPAKFSKACTALQRRRDEHSKSTAYRV
ncbi:MULTISPECIES: hypothetical protein [Alcanivoracaceae]|nr:MULTISPECIES: hypothetical protein [Alcanivoracaceae]